MAIRKKPQTEAKAKGLVGYKGGKQINKGTASANKSVGDYKGRTLNLSQSQLGAAGRKAAGARTVDIGKTTFDKSKGGVLGPGGKPLTGRVDLGGGNIAVYKQGVRVRAVASKPKGGGGGGAGGGGAGGVGGYVMPKRDASKAGKGTPMRPVAERNAPGARANLTPRQIAAARRGEAADKRKGGNTPSGMSAATIRAVGVPASISQGSPKGRPGSRGSGFSGGSVGGGGGGGGSGAIGRDTGNHKTTFYANGTARVWDAKMKKFVTVGKSDSRYPKR